MNIYVLALQSKLRFETSKGSLSVEQLFGLSLEELDALTVKAEEDYKGSTKKSFLVKNTEKDKTAKLKFDILLDVLTTMKNQADDAAQKQENKVHNQKILALIANKEDKELEGKSVEELLDLLK